MSASRDTHPIDLILSRVSNLKPSGNGYKARCPAHPDKSPSLSIREGDNKRVLIKCFAGCPYEKVMLALNLDPSDGFTKEDFFINSNHYQKRYQNSKQHKQDLNSSKKPYKDLKEYTEFKGVEEKVFLDTGWENAYYYGKPALRFMTPNGYRYRLIDGSKPVFISDKGFSSCWYRLTEAVELANQTKSPLILCNGEPSTIVAQYFNLPAFCLSGGETTNIKPALLEELKSKYRGELLIALDNDQAGQKGAIKRLFQLRTAGFNTRAIDFGSDQVEGFDLADFVKIHKENTLSELLKLPDLIVQNKEDETNKKTKKINEEKDKLDDLDFAELFANEYPDYKYDEDAKSWRYWRKTHWQVYNKQEKIKDLIIQIVRKISPTTAISDRKINSILALARAKCLQDFQPERHLINFENGTLHTLTKDFYEHKPEDSLCSVLSYPFNNSTQLLFPNIKNFLESAIPHRPAQLCFMVHCGLSLINDRRMHNGVFFHGATRSGKTVALALVNLINGATMEDAFNFAGASLLDKGTEGKRSRALWNQHKFVGLDELPKETFKSEEILKSLLSHSGTEMRKIGKDETIGNRWQPKLAFAANDKPNLSDASGAIRERLLIISFPRTIPNKEQNKLLIDSFTPELGSFAAMCIKLAEQSLKSGSYPTSKEMKQAFNEMNLLSNPLKMFVIDNCILESSAWTSTAELWNSYKKVCEDAGHNPLGKNRFTASLTDMYTKLKLVRRGSKGERGIAGIRLRRDDDPINGSLSDEESNDENFFDFENTFNSFFEGTDITDTLLTKEKTICQSITPNKTNNITPILTQLTQKNENIPFIEEREEKSDIDSFIDGLEEIDMFEDIKEVNTSVVSVEEVNRQQLDTNQVFTNTQSADTQLIKNVSNFSCVSIRGDAYARKHDVSGHHSVIEAIKMVEDGTVEELPAVIFVSELVEQHHPSRGLKSFVDTLKRSEFKLDEGALNDLINLVEAIKQYKNSL